MFVHRLQICHHMTFRSWHVYLANPCGALTAPTDVMDDAVCTESGLSTKCALYCSVQKEKRGGCDIVSLAADSPGRLFFQKRKHLKKAEPSSCILSIPSPPLLSHLLHPYVMTPGVPLLVMSAAPLRCHEKLVIKMTSHVV